MSFFFSPGIFTFKKRLKFIQFKKLINQYPGMERISVTLLFEEYLEET